MRAAEKFGVPVARGLVSRAEALAEVAAAAVRAAPRRDAGGMRARLAHRLDDATDTHVRERAAAARRVCAAVQSGFDGFASGADTLAAVDAAARGLLTHAETRGLARATAMARLRREG